MYALGVESRTPSNLLIRQSFISVLKIDDAAILKAAFLQGALHWQVVAVGINTQILTTGKALVNAKTDDSPALFRYRNAVNYAVRGIV